MPCRDNFIDDVPAPFNFVKVHEYNQVKQRLDAATRAACTAMKAICSHDPKYHTRLEDGEDVLTWAADYMYVKREDALHAIAWFKDHVQADKDHKEALIESAKAKLSPEEIKALNIK